MIYGVYLADCMKSHSKIIQKVAFTQGCIFCQWFGKK